MIFELFVYQNLKMMYDAIQKKVHANTSFSDEVLRELGDEMFRGEVHDVWNSLENDILETIRNDILTAFPEAREIPDKLFFDKTQHLKYNRLYIEQNIRVILYKSPQTYITRSNQLHEFMSKYWENYVKKLWKPISQKYEELCEYIV